MVKEYCSGYLHMPVTASGPSSVENASSKKKTCRRAASHPVTLVEGEERLGQRKQICLQWIPSHVSVPGNQAFDELADRGCDLSNPTSTVLSHSEIHSLQRTKNEFDLAKPSCSPLNKARKKNEKSTDGQRSYTNHCQNCPNVQLSPQHILSSPAIQAMHLNISLKDPEDLIFSDKVVEVAEALFDCFGTI
ncbi:nup43 [Trichonephila clavipes]|nr:nup43 [Trichonephila clavipes]